MVDRKALRLLVASSWLIAILSVSASLLGLAVPETYRQETANWRMQAWGQDVGNLLAAVVLVVGVYRMKKQSLAGFLVWIGTMFYLLYAYIVYAMAVHLNYLFLVYTTILGLVVYALIYALSVGERPVDEAAYPAGTVRRLAAYVLVLTGGLFAVLWLGELVPALITGTVPSSLTEAGLIVNPIHAIDLSTVLPGFILTGVLALKNRRAGLFFLAPWLAFSALMGSSIVFAMAIILASGDTAALPPMLLVSPIVVVTLVALWRYLAALQRSNR